MNNFFHARAVLKVGEKEYVIYRLDALEKAGLTELKLLPFSIRVLLEAALRQCNDKEITQADVKNIAAWRAKGVRPGIPFLPARVVLQDFTGVPCVVDLAAMRDAPGRESQALRALADLAAQIERCAMGTAGAEERVRFAATVRSVTLAEAGPAIAARNVVQSTL